MKKSQIQKIIAEEIQSVLQERSKRAIEALMNKIRLARPGVAGDAFAAAAARTKLLSYGVKAKDIPKVGADAAKVVQKTKKAVPAVKTGTSLSTKVKPPGVKPPGPPTAAAGGGGAIAVVKGTGLVVQGKQLPAVVTKELVKKLGTIEKAMAWLNRNKKLARRLAAGLITVAALGIAASGGDGGGGGGGPVPKPDPDPNPDPNAGPNAEECKTARGVRNLLKKKAEEVTGKKGVAALRAIPLKGDDNSWIRVSYRKMWSARNSKSKAEAARAGIVSQYGVQLGCTVADPDDAGVDGGMQTSLKNEPGMLGLGTRGPDYSDLTKGAAGMLKLGEPSGGGEEVPEAPVDEPQVKENERTKRFKETYQKRRAMARRAIAKRNKLTDQYVKSYVGRPLRQGETLESWFKSQGSKLPAGYTRKVNQYKEFEKKAMAGTADLVVRKLIPALKKLNPNLSKRQLKAFIDDKPITGTGESPADLPQRGQRDTATMGLTAAERAKLDMTGGPPPLQESKQLGRMKLLAGIQNENK